MSIWRYAEFLPPVPAANRVSLGEGSTPVVRSRRIGPKYGLANLFFKLENANPSGSYKDRFAAVAISDMLASNQTRCLATSSGNTGAALAAYCAAANLECEIAIVETAPDGKLRQMLAYGADIYRVRGFGLDAGITSSVMQNLFERGKSPSAALQISAFCFSPVGMAGVQTIAFELAEESANLGTNFDHVFCPAGGGGLTLAVARGFAQMVEAKRLARSPRIECAQPQGNDTIATPLRNGMAARAVECTSQISGLQVASVLDGDEVIAACRASGGSGHVVSDEEIWEAQKMMAREEGIFSEPAGAVALAAALRARREERIQAHAATVCLVTGSGFKDEASLARMTSDLDCPTRDFSTDSNQ